MIKTRIKSEKFFQIGLMTIALALMSLTATTTTNVFAVNPNPNYGVMTTGSNAGGFPDPNAGDTITGSAATNDASVTKVKFRWIDPLDNTQQEHTITTSTPAGGGSCLTAATHYTGSVSQADVTSGAGFKCFADSFTIPSTIGDWGMQALFCTTSQTCAPSDNQATRAISFDASLFVVPESPVGSVALIMSSLGAIGAFMYIRSRHSLNRDLVTFP